MRLAGVHRLSSGDRSSDFFLNDEVPYLLALDRRRSSPEEIVSLLLHSLVRLDKVAEHLSALCSDNACIDVGT